MEDSVDAMSRRMLCGGLAGMIAKTATNPFERIKMLSQTGEHGMTVGKQTIAGLYRSIIQNEGVLGLWTGNTANLIRVFPSKAIVFSTNDLYTSLLRSFTATPVDKPLLIHWNFVAGGFAGMTATILTYPLDFARGRISGKMKLQGLQQHYTGTFQTITLTLREEGFRALYKGVTPTVMGALPYEGIKFGTVGLMRTLFPSSDNLSPVVRSLLFGGTGGILAAIITYPNDTVRRMLQLQGSRGTAQQYTGYWDCVRQVYGKYGIQRFYHGLTINIIRMAPNTAVQFGTYEFLKLYLL